MTEREYYRKLPPWVYSGQEPPKCEPPPKPDPDLDEHAAWLRSKRDRPEILEAIIAVRGHNNPDDHRYTVAAQILRSVNTWLKESRYNPVSVDALARKIPRA